jgi:hypothetical protein
MHNRTDPVRVFLEPISGSGVGRFDADRVVLAAGLELAVEREHRRDGSESMQRDCSAQMDGVQRPHLRRIDLHCGPKPRAGDAQQPDVLQQLVSVRSERM